MKRSTACSLLAAVVLVLGVASAKASVMDLVQDHARKLQEGGSEAYLALYKTKDSEYFPEKIDWAGVISACRAVGRYEWRFWNFIVRSTFHDSLAINPKKLHGGADASLFLKEELMRPENHGFSAAALRAIAAVASIYQSSMADTLAVCGAVAVQELSRGRATIIGKDGEFNFPVGRLDSMRPAEPKQLPAKDVNVDKFGQFWIDRGFTVQEGVALMGSHALIDDQGCQRSANYKDLCDPTVQSCIEEVRMFKWDSHFYQDACNSKIRFHKNGGETAQGRQGTEEEYQNERKHIMCAYTSQEFQQHQLAKLAEKKACGKFVTTPAEITWEPKCYGSTGRKLSGLIHAPNEWPYTKNDAHLAQACQGKNHKRYSSEVQAAMNAYQDVAVWDAHFTPAYIKMVSKYNIMKTKPSGAHYHINGQECPSGFESGRCSTALADGAVLRPDKEFFPFDGPHVDGL